MTGESNFKLWEEPEGYLAQVVSFQYKHHVVGIDSCSHHGKVTEIRAERIREHYVAQMLKLGNNAQEVDIRYENMFTLSLSIGDCLTVASAKPAAAGTATMKAHGANHQISRSEFEKNPSGYFKDLHNK
ncbi:hypothetical protein LINGRAHAP2_LOCUS14362 [Linum grandiflorum]